MLIARTDPDAPKHKGISYFGIPMHQPGIDVRPLVEMTGRALFNEVFLDDARVADDLLIGGLGNGWAVANTTLMNERASLGGGGGSSATSLAIAGTVAGHLERRAGDFVAQSGRGGTATILAGRSTKLLQHLVAELGKADDPLIRQDLMRLYSMDQISGWGVQRAKAGQASPALPNLAKLMMSHMTRLSRDVGLRIIGPAGTVMGPDTPGGGNRAGAGPVQPGPVDLRRHRRGAAQHHRRAGPGPAQGARPGQEHALQRAAHQLSRTGRNRPAGRVGLVFVATRVP